MARPAIDPLGALAAAAAALVASIPFIASGHVGILGVGLVNDDMASHLLLADWIAERFRPEPVLIDQGYPLGPHALVAGLGFRVGATSIDVFAGLTLAIPSLTALVAWSALDGLGRRAAGARGGARGPAVSGGRLPRPGGVQGADHGPVRARLRPPPRQGTRLARRDPDGRPGGRGHVRLLLPGPRLAGRSRRASGALWRLVEHDVRVPEAPSAARLVLATAVAVGHRSSLLVIPELGRLSDFADFRALHPDQANEGGLGNLPGQLSPLEALGIWPTSEFRLSASAAEPAGARSSTPAARSPWSRWRWPCRAGSAATAPRSPRRSPRPRSSTCWPAASAPSTPRRRRSRSPPRW